MVVSEYIVSYIEQKTKQPGCGVEQLVWTTSNIKTKKNAEKFINHLKIIGENQIFSQIQTAKAEISTDTTKSVTH